MISHTNLTKNTALKIQNFQMSIFFKKNVIFGMKECYGFGKWAKSDTPVHTAESQKGEEKK